MKKILTFAGLSLIALSGCTKSTTSPDTTKGAISPYVMTANIAGTPFSADSCIFFHYLLDTTDVQITGWSGPNTYPQIELHLIYSYHGVGTYTFSAVGGAGFARLNQTSTSGGGESLDNGTVTITAISPNVVGTFSFTTVSGVVVSGGSFTAQRN